MIPVIINLPDDNIEKKLRKKLGNDFNYRVSKKKGDISSIILEEVEAGGDFIVLVGGDTTVDEAINTKVNQRKRKWAVIPFGTANNFAQNLGTKSVSSICELISRIPKGEVNLEEYIIPTDLMKVTYDNEKQFYAASTFSLGWVTMICNQAENNSKKSFLRKIFGFGKKADYFIAAIKTMKDYTPIEAEIDYYLTDGKSERIHLENILIFAISNGPYYASMKNWNPVGCPYDGKIETIGFKNMGLLKKIRVITKMAFSNSDRHITSDKNENGFNNDCINYVDNIKSINIRIQGADKKSYQFIEAGGTTYKPENPDALIKIEVVPEATNFFYMHHKTKSSEGFTRWH